MNGIGASCLFPLLHEMVASSGGDYPLFPQYVCELVRASAIFAVGPSTAESARGFGGAGRLCGCSS